MWLTPDTISLYFVKCRPGVCICQNPRPIANVYYRSTIPNKEFRSNETRLSKFCIWVEFNKEKQKSYVSFEWYLATTNTKTNTLTPDDDCAWCCKHLCECTLVATYEWALEFLFLFVASCSNNESVSVFASLCLFCVCYSHKMQAIWNCVRREQCFWLWFFFSAFVVRCAHWL